MDKKQYIGFDVKSGWLGVIDRKRKILFPTENEYDEYIDDENTIIDHMNKEEDEDML